MCIHFLQQRRPPILPCLQVCIIIYILMCNVMKLFLFYRGFRLGAGNGPDILSSGR